MFLYFLLNVVFRVLSQLLERGEGRVFEGGSAGISDNWLGSKQYSFGDIVKKYSKT